MTVPSPLTDDRYWLAWTGMETDLIFNQGYDLPEFAAFPMIDSDAGRTHLRGYYDALLTISRDTGVGVILDTPTWMANPDRAAAVGYAAEDLPRVTRDAVTLVRDILAANPGVAAVASVQIGPRGDGYAAGQADAEEAGRYHGPQIDAARAAGADIVAAYTLGSSAEAIGIARAASRATLPALISYTVETDGKLADGTPLSTAVAHLKQAAPDVTVMVNCAHPDHIACGLDGGAWQRDLSGIIANASRQSHEELDNATVLDDGNPAELGQQLHGMARESAAIRVVGGCCGTDLRHLREIAERLGRVDRPA
ncbi:homocysteine S-methyltransferase family protein [Jannaschia sp. M317]|uniref:homocysteine S-methyltransferase family protein n=1 Tax=Jannaschia sp. M317 TaxID=2867011 RepID=UPI0021A8781F|nr:homocysteine S-methyltransferase family protein [Jannaschia sp. M317]UWQ19866.1 homocysteine S-methyltransferase family protein [Jannaschia sp. M317]